MPHVALKEQVFEPSALWATVTVLVYRVLVWLPDRPAVKLNVYLVPFMVTLPDLEAVELIVYVETVETSCTFTVTLLVLLATLW